MMGCLVWVPGIGNKAKLLGLLVLDVHVPWADWFAADPQMAGA